MRKLAATTAAAVLLTAGLGVPAWAATPEAPTDVQVAWVDGKVRVTWKDSGEANLVVLASSASQYIAAEPAAADPNELLLDPSVFRDQAEMRISVRTVVDREKSTPAYSQVFDTHRVAKTSLASAVSTSGRSVRMLLLRDAITDTNPADPLDQPGEWLKATVTGPAAGQQTEFSLPAGAEHIDVPIQPGSVTIKLATGNEWGTSQIFGTVQVGTMRVSAAMPARASWQMFTITGRVYMSQPTAGEAISVGIQARPNAASPWKFISGTSAQTGSAILPATLGPAGGQEYRLWVYETSALRSGNTFLLTPAASTTGKFVRRNALIDRSEFYPTRAPAGTTVTLLVHVGPEQAMKAALQKWDGKQWHYLRPVQLDAKGNASIAMRTPLRGTAKYRIATPAVKYKGLPVDASTSLPFALTVL